MAGVLGTLRQAFRAYPLAANCLLYGGVWMTSKAVEQAAMSRHKPTASEMEVANIARAGLFGSCVAGPTLFYWYKWLDHKFVGTARRTVAWKCALDLVVLNPYTWTAVLMVPVVGSVVLLTTAAFVMGDTNGEYSYKIKKTAETGEVTYHKKTKTEWSRSWTWTDEDEQQIYFDYIYKKVRPLFWVPAQAVNFLFIPPELRILFIGGAKLLLTGIDLASNQVEELA